MTYLGFEAEKANATVKELNQLLANYHIYYQNLRNFHWNIKGSNFFELHAKFEELYNDARINIDDLAERILTLRSRPVSSFSDYLKMSAIKEAGEITSDRDMVLILLENHKHLIANLRKIIKAASACGDEGTIDMAGSILENIEKKSWMLDAWVSVGNSVTAN